MGKKYHLCVVQLKGKHCRKPHCCNGVVDTFKQKRLPTDNVHILSLAESIRDTYCCSEFK